MPKKRPSRSAPQESGRITYRDLRNTPGRVWERLAKNEPLTLVAEGETKAVVIPVPSGDASETLEAYRRGAAMMALARMRRRARETGTSKLSLPEINNIIHEMRCKRPRGA